LPQRSAAAHIGRFRGVIGFVEKAAVTLGGGVIVGAILG
jgi:hypothetical protein